MWFGIITLATALIISISAAYYSILGLTAIFAAAFWPIVILGSSLEVGKIVSTLWLHKYWNRAEAQYKVYLCTAVAILMVLTSMGVFGFLSKAHTDQSLVSGDVVAKISIYDEKIKQSRDNISVARSALTQMDAAVDQTMSRSTDERGADKAAQLRRSQANERNRLLKEIDAEQKKIQVLNEQRAPIAAEIRKVEAEVGPIKYIAALIYGDNPEANVLEKSVRWVIILIVIVFDPLALTLLLAATKSIEWERGINSTIKRKEPEYEQDNGPLSDDQLDQLRAMARVECPTGKIIAKDFLFEHAGMENEQASLHSKKQQILSALDSMWNSAKRLVKSDAEPDHATLTGPNLEINDVKTTIDGDFTINKLAERAWKDENPDKTLKHQRDLFDAGILATLPWMEPNFMARALGKIPLEADNAPAGTQGQVRGFGSQFPIPCVRGDMFLRTDCLPSALYKFNGTDWIEIDKELSDTYAYDGAYIDHLIAKISSGEYDPELLSNAERDQIENKLKN